MNANWRATTPAASMSQGAPAFGMTRLRLPFAGRHIQRMLAIYITLLFVVSANVLDSIGYDYSSIGGSPITKIHVSTYFIVVLFSAFIVSYPQKHDLVRYYLATKLGTIYFLCAATFAFIYIMVDGRSDIGMYFDTDLHLFLCCMLLPFMPPAGMDRLERFLHWFFAANAVLAIFELAIGANIFPLITYSPDGVTSLEPRATAFLSHPLHAATITCVYIASLLTGAGRLLRPSLRVPMIGLQITALLGFGGRTAFVLTVLILALVMLWRTFEFAAGKRISYAGVMAAVSVVLICIAAVPILAYLGLFDQLLDRFAEDGGSSRSRLLMLPLVRSFNWGDLLWGANTDYVKSQVYSFGLEWGVENPFLQISVDQGVVVASLVMTGFLLVFYDAYKRLMPRVIVPMGVYLLLCSTFGSFSGRFFTFSIFMVVIATLFRREDAPTRFVS